MEKVCSKCKISKELTLFSKDRITKDGLHMWCKPCDKEYKTLNREKIKEQQKIYNFESKEQRKEYYKIYNKNNREKIKEYKIKNREKEKIYRNTNEFKKGRLEYQKLRYLKDPKYKYRQVLGVMTYRAYKGEVKTSKTLEILGCSLKNFILYLESHPEWKPEMSHENHGQVWEIDHIRPLSSFDLTNEEERKKSGHYTNLQPLFKTNEIAESLGYENYIGNKNKSNKFS
jgi:thiol-disulfide isomerase/thioredoxin